MKNIVIGIASSACVVAALMAQSKINPTDPQPTCNMCPGQYIPVSELQAYTKKAIAERLTDEQVWDIEIGKAHIGIGMVHRGKLDAPAADSVAEHDQVSEVYYIIDGTATARPRSGYPQQAAASRHAPNSPRVQRTRKQRIGNSERCRVPAQARRRGSDTGRHRSPVHEDRRSHRLSDGQDRSRQGHADQGRGRVESVLG